jgi:hypothetical protein
MMRSRKFVMIARQAAGIVGADSAFGAIPLSGKIFTNVLGDLRQVSPARLKTPSLTAVCQYDSI